MPWKRVLDIAVSAAALAVLWPVLLIVAAAASGSTQAVPSCSRSSE